PRGLIPPIGMQPLQPLVADRGYGLPIGGCRFGRNAGHPIIRDKFGPRHETFRPPKGMALAHLRQNPVYFRSRRDGQRQSRERPERRQRARIASSTPYSVPSQPSPLRSMTK